MIKYASLEVSREAFRRGGNVLQTHRDADAGNAVEAIEIAYELQAGQYVRNHAADPGLYDAIVGEQVGFIRAHFPEAENLLDAGCGELTNTLLLRRKLDTIDRIVGFDLSWSRLHVGWNHYRERVGSHVVARTRIFVADMAQIPLPDNCIDVVVTTHALEPNRGWEVFLLSELLRVARRGLVLFEPSYELGSDAQRAYMDTHGYVRDLAGHATRLGGEVVEHRLTEVLHNPNNRSAALVVAKRDRGIAAAPVPVDPVSRERLVYDETDNVWHAPGRGLVYPVLWGIPVLRESAGVLATGFAADRTSL